jgi:hypothetical protein
MVWTNFLKILWDACLFTQLLCLGQGLFELPIGQSGRRPTASGPPAAMRSIQEAALFAESKKRKADQKPIDAFLDRAMPVLDGVNTSVEKTLVDLAFFTLVSDGWSNLRNESLVNYVFTEALSGTSVLFDVVSYGVNRHTAATILASIETGVIAPLKSKGDSGFYKLVAYVTDSASNYKSARNLLERVR